MSIKRAVHGGQPFFNGGYRRSFIEIVIFDIVVVAELVVIIVVEVLILIIIEVIVIVVEIVVKIVIVIEIIVFIAHIVVILIEVFVIVIDTIIEMNRRAEYEPGVFYRAFPGDHYNFVFGFSRFRCTINGGHRSILPHCNIEKFQGLRTMLLKSGSVKPRNIAQATKI